MANKTANSKSQYILPFIFGMIIMGAVYVLFDLSTQAEYRTRTSTSAGGDTTSGAQLTAGSTSNIIQVASTDTTEPKVFLGVEAMDLNDVLAEQFGIQNGKGVLINGVVPQSPAAAAGLKRGDVITFFNNRAVLDTDSFKRIISNLEPGDKVRIVYVRDKEKESTYAVVTALSQTTATVSQSSSVTEEWGVSLSPLSTALRSSYSIPDDISGVMILSVVPGGLADSSGLRPGDVIVGIDKSSIESLDDFFNAIAQDTNATALLDIYSQGSRRYVALDSSAIQTADQVQDETRLTLRDKIFAIFTGGAPFTSSTDDDDAADEEGPKGGKFATDSAATLTADTTTAFNRPSSPPIESSTSSTGPSSSSSIALNRPSQVPGATTSDTVFFIGILVVVILYLAYREFHRPPDSHSSTRNS